MSEQLPLPGELEEIANLVGRQKALMIAGRYGGKSLGIPIDPKPNHKLTEVVGLEDAIKISKEFRGITLCIPRCEHILRAYRNRMIIRRYKAGESIEALALDFEVSTRLIQLTLDAAHVRVKRGRTSHPEHQLLITGLETFLNRQPAGPSPGGRPCGSRDSRGVSTYQNKNSGFVSQASRESDA